MERWKAGNPTFSYFNVRTLFPPQAQEQNSGLFEEEVEEEFWYVTDEVR
jgi:hypothetical protein